MKPQEFVPKTEPVFALQWPKIEPLRGEISPLARPMHDFCPDFEDYWGRTHEVCNLGENHEVEVLLGRIKGSNGVVHPGYWIVKSSTGRYSFMSDGDFRRRYEMPDWEEE